MMVVLSANLTVGTQLCMEVQLCRGGKGGVEDTALRAPGVESPWGIDDSGLFDRRSRVQLHSDGQMYRCPSLITSADVRMLFTNTNSICM